MNGSVSIVILVLVMCLIPVAFLIALGIGMLIGGSRRKAAPKSTPAPTPAPKPVQPKVVPQQIQPSPAVRWACDICGRINRKDAKHCANCGSGKPGSKAPAGKLLSCPKGHAMLRPAKFCPKCGTKTTS